MPLINFSGLASGIDSEALIEATIQAQEGVRITPKEDKISDLEDTNSALEELKTKLSTLQSTLKSFATINGGIVAKQAVSSNESVITGAANNSATAGTYSFTVTQLAKNATVSLASAGQTYTSQAAVINSSINPGAAAADRTVSIDVGTGANQETVDVVLTNTTTLDDFATQFNTNSNKAVATIVNVGTSSSPDYVIMITSNEQGEEDGTITISSVGTEITTAGSGAFDDNTVSQATNAEFSVDGIGGTITRQSNTVSDLVAGVTFNLAATGTATVSIGNDNATTASSAQEFIEIYNEIVEFVKENNEITREEDGEDVENIFGALAKTRLDDNVLTSLRSDISGSSISDGSAETVTIFAAMGITTERDGTLAFDAEDFETAMNNEPNAVRDLFQNFADATSLTGGTIDQYIRFNGLFDTTTNGNSEQVSNLNDQIARQRQIIEAQAAQLRARFARLEGLIGNLQNQQNSLTSILGGAAA